MMISAIRRKAGDTDLAWCIVRLALGMKDLAASKEE
jgi:hypothetical protein